MTSGASDRVPSPDRAGELFDMGYNCAQAVFGAVGEAEGLSLDDCLKAACALGAGMCRRADTCGAVTGGLMAIGLRYGGPRATDPSRKGVVYDHGQEFIAQFTRRNGSIVCREILSVDISTPEGMAAARDRGLFRTLCPKLVRDAVQILEEMPARPAD